MWSSALVKAINTAETAAIPELKARPRSPPSNAAIRSSKMATVGLPNRE